MKSKRHHHWLTDYTTDVTKNCTLRSDLNQVPKSVFKRKKAKNGSEYWELHFKLLVSVSAKMVFAFEVAGKQYGQVDADY